MLEVVSQYEVLVISVEPDVDYGATSVARVPVHGFSVRNRLGIFAPASKLVASIQVCIELAHEGLADPDETRVGTRSCEGTTRWRFTHCGGFRLVTDVGLCVFTNVGVEDLLVAPLALLQLQLHLEVFPTRPQNNVLVVGLLQSGQGHIQ